MFEQFSPNIYEGESMVYVGSGDYRRDPRLGIKLCETCNNCVLHIGESVMVESLWYRNAHENDDMMLAYVRGDNTGQATHVPLGDLVYFVS